MESEILSFFYNRGASAKWERNTKKEKFKASSLVSNKPIRFIGKYKKIGIFILKTDYTYRRIENIKCLFLFEPFKRIILPFKISYIG